MKKYSIVFNAIPFTGSFDAIDQAANGYSNGSGASFVETESEKGKSLQFTDANGQTQTANIGDALKVVHAPDGGFVGYILATAVEVATWIEVDVAPATAAAQS